MPLKKLVLTPGLNREGTNYSNEGGWYDGDKIRFRSGNPEKIGGWTRVSNSTFQGTARSLWNWVTFDGNNYLGVGTNLKYYIELGGSYNDITPLRATYTHSTTPTTDNCFTTTVGSNIVKVTIVAHGAIQNDFVTFSGATAVGGVPAVDLNSEHQITYIDPNNFSILVATAATSTVALAGGTAITAKFQIATGLDVYVIGVGWGAGPFPAYVATNLTNPFTATATGISVLTVTQTAHGLTTGDYVFFNSIASNPCGINRLVLQKAFQITKTGDDTYTISTVIGSTTYLTTSTAASGGAVTVYKNADGVRGWGDGFTSGIGQQLRLWSNDNYGQDYIIAPRGGAIYYWKNSDTVQTRATLLATLSTAALGNTPAGVGYGVYVPTATNQILASALQRFVIAFGANSYAATQNSSPTPFDPMLVRWSDQDQPYQWVPSITNQSGEFRLTHGSFIVTAQVARVENLIWTDSCLYSMQYLGPPYVYKFDVLMDNISIISPNAVISINNVTYWMGLDKFYMYNGTVSTLPCTLKQYVFEDLNSNQGYQIFAGGNSGYNEVWWFYCSEDTNLVNKYVIFNYLDQVWYSGNMARTAWLDSGVRPYPLAATYVPPAVFIGSISGTTLTISSMLSGGVSYNNPILGTGIADNTVITQYLSGVGNEGTYTVNNSQTVGSTSMSILGTIGRTLYHESAVDDISGLSSLPIVSYVQSSDFDIEDGQSFGFVWRMLPDVNFNGSNVGFIDPNDPTQTISNPYVSITIKPRQNSGAPYGTADAPLVTSGDNFAPPYPPNSSVYVVQQFTGQVYTRLRGRQMSFRIGSDSLGVAWQLGHVRYDVRPDGRR